MPYSGSGKNPYWMTIAYGGVANPGSSSELVPVVVDGVTTYSLSNVAQWEGASSNNVAAQVVFYDAGNNVLSTISQTQSVAGNGGSQTAWATTPTIAPTGAAYLIATTFHNITTDVLRVLYSGVVTGSNSAQPSVVNLNYAFVYGYDHWTPFNSAVLGWEFDPLTTADNDYDSLVIDGLLELMGGAPGVQSLLPELVDPVSGRGAMFRIAAPGGVVNVGTGTSAGPYDLGTPQPTSDIIENLLLDGERPKGKRASNRVITVPVLIFAPSLTTLAAARETLLSVIDQQTFKMYWRSAESGLTQEYDCFRASQSTVTYGFNYNRPAGQSWALSVVNISLPAAPYARSGQDGVEIVNFTDGTLDAGKVTAQQVVDNFSSVNASSDGGGKWLLNTAYAFGGSQSARYEAPVPMKMPWAPATYAKTGLSLNLTGLQVIAAWIGQSYDTQWPLQKNFTSNLTMSWTLTDGTGKTISFSGRQDKCPWGANPNRPVWTRVGAQIPQGLKKSVFDYSNVTGYKIRITNWSGSGTSGYVRMHAWLSQVVAMAKSTKWVTTPHGSVYSVFGLNRMARSPVSAEIQLASLNPVTVELTKTGAWTVPAKVTSVFGEAFGAGGGGASVNDQTNLYAAGGAGGEYAAEPLISVIPGTLVPFQIGAGGAGGNVVARSALFLKPGKNTWTCPGGVSVINVYSWGGGAAGAAGGGGGGAGAFTQGTINVTPGVTYTFDVGPGGKANYGTLSRDQATRHGGDTVVRGDTGSIHAHGGTSPLTGSSVGGPGGLKWTTAETGTTLAGAQAGGNGGKSPGGAGGGGGGAPNQSLARNNGLDSPKGSNNYGSGGPGAPALIPASYLGMPSNYVGSGGKGADVGGKPASGVAPGGGGGGGYSRDVNNNGGSGADGAIVLTWNQNLGTPVNGGNTIFGQTGLTSKVLTAHGGSTPANNSAAGSAGGTGSTNTVHKDGGKGGLAGNFKNYLNRVNGNPTNLFSLLFQGFVTGTGGSTAASGVAQGTGVAIATILATTGIDVTNTNAVTDSAGNVYDYVGSAVLPTFGYTVYYFAARVGSAITTSTTLTIAPQAATQTFIVEWHGSNYYSDVDTANLTTATGTSSVPSVSNVNPDPGVHKGMFTTFYNNSTATISTDAPDPASKLTGTDAGSKYNLGAIETAHYIKEIPGSPTASSTTVALSASVPWAALSLPLIPMDTASPYVMKIGPGTSSTGTTCVYSFNANDYPITGGFGYMMAVVQSAGAMGTTSFTDPSGNVWTQKGTVTIGSSVFRIYTAPCLNSYTMASTVTFNDSTSQAHRLDLYYVPGAVGVDVAYTNTGTGTSATLNGASGNSADHLKVYVFANASTVDPTVDPAAWVSLTAESNGALHNTPYMLRETGRTNDTATVTYAGSTAWGAIGLHFNTTVTSGSGGSSGGPGGAGNDGTDSGGSSWEGGGKGANGLGATSGNGVDGAVPGGGGSGAAGIPGASTPLSAEGGSGGAGLVRLTYQPPLRTFNDLIIHRPGDGAKHTLNPLVMIPPNDPPDGREYNVLPLVTGHNAEFQGTYSVLLVANAWNSATSGTSRRISVTVNQYTSANGSAVSVQATRVVTPDTDIINGYVDMGTLTLPIKDYDVSNDNIRYTVSVHDTDTGDSFQDLLLLDVSGQTFLVNIAPGTAGDNVYSSFYIDEPTYDRALGQVLGTSHGRPQAISVFDMAMNTGGPLYLESGENLLLVYSTGGAPNLGLSYDPRWHTDRIK